MNKKTANIKSKKSLNVDKTTEIPPILDDESSFWKGYDASIYKKPSVAVDVVAFTIDDDEKENYRKNHVKTCK